MSIQSAELINLVERSGMRGELEQRVEAQNLEKRKQLIAERRRLLEERDRVMPALEAEAAAAREAYALCEQKLRAARQVMDYTQMRAYGIGCSYGTAQIDQAIERAAPRFLQDGFDTLQEPLDFLSSTVRFWSHRQRIGWGGYRTVDLSDIDEVAALRQRCEQGQAEVKAMMYDNCLSIDEMRSRCAAIVEECLALTRPRLKDDRHWLTHQERKARAVRKSA